MKYVRVRVAGLLREGNKILFIKHRKENEEYWLLPGGGVDFGEDFKKSLRREYKEELGIEIKVNEPVFLLESIDPRGSRHIVNVVFMVEKTGGSIKLGDEPILAGYSFIDVSEIDNYTIYPNIKTELKNMILGNKNELKFLENRWE